MPEDVEIRRGYVDAPTGQVHYRTTGSGAVVLLLHQSARTGAIYRRLAGFLAPYCRVLMMDLPGFGESDPLPAPFEIADIVASVVALLDGLGIDKVRVCGHHTGATVAVELAASHPERVVAVASTGLSYRTPGEHQDMLGGTAPRPITQMGGHSIPVVRELRSDGSHLLRLFQRATAMLWLNKLSLGATGTTILPFENLPQDDLAFVNDFVVDGLKALETAPLTLAAASRYEPAKRLPLIKAPMLFIRSTGPLESDYFQRTDLLQKLVPGSKVADVTNGDIHVIHTRAPELSELLLDFFELR